MVTLRDIAREVQLDVSTVSHLLNRPERRYNPATRRRVQEVARRMGYRPNALARAMVHGKSRSIGIVGHDLATSLNVERLQAIATSARSLGYHMFLSSGQEETPALIEETIEDLLARKVDGLIVFIAPEADTRYYESLRKRGVPFVLIGTLSRPSTLPLVMIDGEAGGYAATRHLLALGHREIAFASGRYMAQDTSPRRRGFERAMREAGAPIPAHRVLSDQAISRQSVGDFTRRQLRGFPRATAILNANDNMAFTCIHAIAEMGLRVPQDVSVVGYDDLPIAQDAWPELTTIRQPRAEVSQAAVGMLIDQIEGNRSSQRLVLKPELIVRQSTAPVGVEAGHRG